MYQVKCYSVHGQYNGTIAMGDENGKDLLIGNGDGINVAVAPANC